MSATCSRPASARPARLAAPCSSRARSLRVMAQVLAFSGLMLGDDGTARHAVKIDETAKQVNPVIPAFTRRREVFAGRLAMFGWLAETIGEILLRTGPVGQLEYILGFERNTVIALFVGIVLFNGIGAAFPNSPTWSKSNQDDVAKRPDGPPQDPNILINKPGQALGMTRPGFSRQNELFVGRAGMLGFLAAVIAEVLYNKGPWAMVASFIGQTPDDGYYRLIGYGLGISAIAVTVLGYTLDNGGEDDTGKDIY
ncbi:hypothetical protein V8C86DRAFT_3137486 [Haematococcus lacustris]